MVKNKKEEVPQSALDELKVQHAQDYLAENLKNHSISDLKSALLAGGYKEEEINEAIKRHQGSSYVDTPISIDRLFKDSWNFFTTNFKSLFAILFVSWLPAIIYLLVNNSRIMEMDKADILPERAVVVFRELISLPFNIVLLVFAVVALIWGFTAFYKAIVDLDRKEEKNLKAAFLASGVLILPLVHVFLLQTLLVALGFLLIIIPAIIFSVWFTFSEFTLIAEEKTGWQALKRSKELVKGKWWSVFVRVILVAILANVVMIPVSLLSVLPYVGVATNIVASIIATIFLSIFQYKLYKGLVEIKKN